MEMSAVMTGTTTATPAAMTLELGTGTVTRAAIRDRMIVTILEEIKGQERQNTLMLQALLKRQPQVEQERGSLRLDEFRFPLAIKEDIDRMERMLMDQATEKALVCDRYRDRMIVTILEEIKGQGRQNTLMLQALLKRQPQVEQERGSLRLDEFRFPLAIKEDIDRVERMLMDQATEKALNTVGFESAALSFSLLSEKYTQLQGFKLQCFLMKATPDIKDVIKAVIPPFCF
ncbi:UNVERIFIED_CONTAM: hypothetical protein FKN15_026084 [Acipenser sinensis]